MRSKEAICQKQNFSEVFPRSLCGGYMRQMFQWRDVVAVWRMCFQLEMARCAFVGVVQHCGMSWCDEAEVIWRIVGA